MMNLGLLSSQGALSNRTPLLGGSGGQRGGIDPRFQRGYLTPQRFMNPSPMSPQMPPQAGWWNPGQTAMPPMTTRGQPTPTAMLGTQANPYMLGGLLGQREGTPVGQMTWGNPGMNPFQQGYSPPQSGLAPNPQMTPQAGTGWGNPGQPTPTAMHGTGTQANPYMLGGPLGQRGGLDPRFQRGYITPQSMLAPNLVGGGMNPSPGPPQMRTGLWNPGQPLMGTGRWNPGQTGSMGMLR